MQRSLGDTMLMAPPSSLESYPDRHDEPRFWTPGGHRPPAIELTAELAG